MVGLISAPVAAQQPPPRNLTVQLNALDQTDASCRVVFTARNGLDTDITSLVLEVVAFDTDGAVGRIALFDFADLPADVPRVRQFDLPDLGCSKIGSLLVNGVQSCEGAEGCAAALDVSSRVDDVELLG